MSDIFVYINHKDGQLNDSAFELINAAKKIDDSAKIIALVFGNSTDAEKIAIEASKIYKEVFKIAGDTFAYPNAEIIRKALLNFMPHNSIFLISHDTFSMDLAAGLSVKMNSSFASDVVGFEENDGTNLKVLRQEFDGAVHSKSFCSISDGAVISVRAGIFATDETQSENGNIVDKTSDVGDISVKRKFVEVIEAEVGDVDITKSEILVSIGRGIEEEDNIEEAKELAKEMGADLACSRPIVDAKWLEKSRQVGTSGQTVKPKVYLALGISGSFQHLGGIKGNPFIVAVNKNPKAPIFQSADVGIVTDILDFIPELTEKIQDSK